MSGIFPKSGVPASDAKNSVVDPILSPPECEALWYSTSRCQPRFDPAAANASMSEILNLVNCFGGAYECESLDNLCRILKALFDGVYLPVSTVNATANLHLPNTSAFVTYTGAFTEVGTINGGVDMALGAGTITLNKTGGYLIWGHGVCTCIPSASPVLPGVFDIGGQLGTVSSPTMVQARERLTLIQNAAEVTSTRFIAVPLLLGAGTVIRPQFNVHTEATGVYGDAIISDVRFYIQQFPIKPYA